MADKNATAMRVAFAGAGEVGGSVLRILRDQSALLASRCARPIEVCAIGVRDVQKARARLPEVYAPLLTEGWETIAAHPKADVVVELMGGEDDARQCILCALENNKAIVTANKALLASHGDVIFAAAQAVNKPVAFEAAIAGCIPVVKILRETLAGDNIQEIAGIINGTCNYIITAMSEHGVGFDNALADAQKLGYAEAIPDLDIKGWDAAHKIILISQLAFNARPALSEISVTGISNITPRDIHDARQFGFCIKLLAQARRLENNVITVSVQPTLVDNHHPIAAVNGSMNAVLARAQFSGETMYYGAGAGGDPTAIAVCSDLIDIARDNGALYVDNKNADITIQPPAQFYAPYFLRMQVLDIPGVLAKIANILAVEGISIEAIHQNESAPNQAVGIIILLHHIERGKVDNAIAQIERLGTVFGGITVMPILRSSL